MFQLIKNTLRDTFSAVLSDRQILKYNQRGLLIEQPLRSEQLQPNSIDLTLGSTWKIIKPNTKLFCGEILDPKLPVKFEEGVFEYGRLDDGNGRLMTEEKDYKMGERYILKPHSFVLMASNEILVLPNGIIGFVCGRSSIARLAIQTEQAGLVDAGFRGTITFEIQNQNDFPVLLYPGMRVAQVYFLKAGRALVPYGTTKGSKYNGQIEAMQSKLHLDLEWAKK